MNEEDAVFVDYLTNTLIPDLHNAGNHETAKDFEQCVKTIKFYADRLDRVLDGKFY